MAARVSPKKFPMVLLAMLAAFSLAGCSTPTSDDARSDSFSSAASSASSASTASPEPTSTEQPVPSDQVEVTVYNACGVEGLAAAGVEKAKKLGFPNAETKNAAHHQRDSMVIYRSDEFEIAAQELARSFGVETVSVSNGDLSTSWIFDGDIAIVLAGDYALAEGAIDELPERSSWESIGVPETVD